LEGIGLQNQVRLAQTKQVRRPAKQDAPRPVRQIVHRRPQIPARQHRLYGDLGVVLAVVAFGVPVHVVIERLQFPDAMQLRVAAKVDQPGESLPGKVELCGRPDEKSHGHSIGEPVQRMWLAPEN